jgi:hypothetical protein
VKALATALQNEESKLCLDLVGTLLQRVSQAGQWAGDDKAAVMSAPQFSASAPMSWRQTTVSTDAHLQVRLQLGAFPGCAWPACANVT